MNKMIITGGKPLTQREVAAEKLMNDNGIKFVIGESTRARQDRKASKENAARHGKPILDEAKQRYRLAMQNGYIFNMPVVVRRTNPEIRLRDTIIGGNNRDAAWESLGVTVYDAYIIEYDETRHDLLFNLLPKALNLLNGVPPTPEEILRDAVSAVDPKMKNLKQVADIFGLSTDTIRTHLQSNKVKSQVQDTGVDVAKVEATGNLLYPLWDFHPESVRVAMGRVAVLGGMSKNDLKAMISDVKTKPSEAAMLKTVEVWAIAHPDKKKKKRDATGRTDYRRRIIAAIHTCSTIIGQRKTLAELGFNAKDITDVAKGVEVIRGLAQKLAVLEIQGTNLVNELKKQ